jgi:hypothetical protein
MPLVISYCFRESHHNYKGVLSRMSLIVSTISDCPTHDSKMSVSVVLPAVAKTRNLLHKLEGDYFEVDDNMAWELAGVPL